MRLEPEWALARRIALLVADSPGRGLHRLDLLDRLGMPWVDVKPSAMLAYKRGGIDFCRDYVIAPARRSRPQPELAAPFTAPFIHPLDTPPQVGYDGSMTHTEREPQPSDAELEARADDLYTAIMAALDSLPAATWTPEYREAKRQVQAMEIEFRAVCLELSTRLHARSVAWNELPDLTGGR